MFDMNENRIDYVGQLRPPDGYQLNFAVATTYSLDLGALLGVCLSLSNQLYSGDPTKANRVQLFASLEHLRDRIAVFCEKGRIKNDEYTKNLCVLLEGIVHQVVVSLPASAGSAQASFHPKVWVVDYENPYTGEHLYRLLVMSRNLTFDGSWDVVASLDGRDAGELVDSSVGIVDLLRYLRTSASTECDVKTAQSIAALESAIATVRFEHDPTAFSGFEFLPIGPTGSGLRQGSSLELFNRSYYRALVVSPFLGASGPLELMANNYSSYWEYPKPLLISTEQALGNLPEHMRDRYACYTPKSWLSDAALDNDDGGRECESIAVEYSRLHAKMYVVEDSESVELYLGSLNASHNGITNNVEALIRFTFSKKRRKFKTTIEALLGDEKPFGEMPATLPAGEDSLEQQNQDALDIQFHAAVKHFAFRSVEHELSENGTYKQTVEFDFSPPADIAKGLVFYLAPYLRKDTPARLHGESVGFSELTVTQVSQFFVLSCENQDGTFQRSCVVYCPSGQFDDSPLGENARMKGLLDRILGSGRDELALYITYALGFNFASTAGFVDADGSGGSWAVSNMGIGQGIYERLLKTLGNSPDASAQLKHAQAMLDYLPDRYQTEERIQEMRNLITVFEEAIDEHE